MPNKLHCCCEDNSHHDAADKRYVDENIFFRQHSKKRKYSRTTLAVIVKMTVTNHRQQIKIELYAKNNFIYAHIA